MIRLVFLLRRKAGMSREAFQDYWLNRHGPLVASHAAHLDILRYVQVHTLDTPANEAMAKARGGKMEEPYDGVAELWWSTDEAFSAPSQTAEGRDAGAALLTDEATFIDLPASPLWLACEYPQINPAPENIVATPKSNLVRLFFPLRQLSSLSEDDARTYWLRNHGPVIRSHAAASGMLRYLQVHRIEHPAEAALRAARGTTVAPYLGHAEVWLTRDRVPTDESRAAGAAAVADESHFIDFERSAMWLAKEHVVIDRR